jgi:hypothetical protein
MSSPVAAPSLFDQFNALTTSDILAFVADRRGEDLTLDFKLASKNFDHADERKVLAATISAFANSSGGLIVWGIDARRGKGDEVDCAQQASPLSNPDLFMSRLVEYASTAPPAPGVLHRRVDGDGGPFAVTYVPESDRGPHMAKNGEDRYYHRSGGSSLKMEHYSIQDMFGRRPRPSLQLIIRKIKPTRLLVEIENKGRGAARSLYLGLRVPDPFKPSPKGYDGEGSFWLKKGGYASKLWRFGGDTGTILFSGQRLPVTIIDWNVPAREVERRKLSVTPMITGRHTFRYELAAEEIPIESGVVEIDE